MPKKEKWEEGVCGSCSNVGLVGDTCPICGGTFVNLDDFSQADDSEENEEKYPKDLVGEDEDVTSLESLEEETGDEITD